ncbi:hypothetical protein BC831DRAFT_468450 [Entophlyctis helioformis]|nr:hypothetical protein BC831DRAFT_468450 [Entophlyctis helioformis]
MISIRRTSVVLAAAALLSTQAVLAQKLHGASQLVVVVAGPTKTLATIEPTTFADPSDASESPSATLAPIAQSTVAPAASASPAVAPAPVASATAPAVYAEATAAPVPEGSKPPGDVSAGKARATVSYSLYAILGVAIVLTTF